MEVEGGSFKWFMFVQWSHFSLVRSSVNDWDETWFYKELYQTEKGMLHLLAIVSIETIWIDNSSRFRAVGRKLASRAILNQSCG